MQLYPVEEEPEDLPPDIDDEPELPLDDDEEDDEAEEEEDEDEELSE